MTRVNCLPWPIPWIRCGRKERLDRANTLLECFGLVEQVNDVVGKSLSTGQKRRLAVAEQLVTGPKILFLDEPTSGLDSVASFHILSHLRAMAKQYNIIVICSIHQPSVTMLEQFDKLVLLSKGKTHYFGLVKDVVDYYDSIDVEVPDDVNPAEFMLSLVNVDFSGSTNLAASQRLTQLQDLWHASSNAQATRDQISASQTTSQTLSAGESLGRQTHKWKRIIPLLHRNLLKALRDNMAYKFRLVMYTGLGVLMGSIWLRLDHDQSSIQLLINAIVVACGFMAFMAVTYVPAFVEDHQQYKREHRNGLYGATLFQVSNFLTGIPFLFLFALSFSAVFYWLSNGHNSASAFMTWVMWLFLNLVAAEAVIVAVVAIVPGFTGSLVLAALINVLMFATAGTLVPPEKLNSFYKYGFYYWNFQTYVFQGMMKTQFNGLLYTCGSQCLCTYAPTTPTSCQVSGDVVLDLYGVDVDHQTRNVGFVLAIILGFRLVAWVVIKLKH